MKTIISANTFAATNMLTATINTNLTLDGLAGGFIELLIKLSMYVGIIYIGLGVFEWLMAKNESNPGDQNKAVVRIVVGCGLVGLRILLQLVGVIS